MLTLLDEINTMWKDKKKEIEKKLHDRAKKINDGRKNIERLKKDLGKNRRLAHQSGPLKFYTSISKLSGKEKIVLSIRYLGQEVGVLSIPTDKSNYEVQLIISEANKNKNEEYFGVEIEIGAYNWKKGKATEFRKSFQKHFENTENPVGRIQEHRIESAIIDLMRSRNSIEKPIQNIQPVLVGGYPLQIPLPLSGSTGKPKYTDGHIDILARRKGHLSLWELKSPKIFDKNKTIQQAYIYTVQILKILRTTTVLNGEKKSIGQEYYKLFGFSSKLHEKITVETVICVTKDKKDILEETLKEIIVEMPLSINSDEIEFFAAYYEAETIDLKLKKLS